MRGFERPDELAGLLVVRVGREGDVVHGHLQLQLLARHGGDLLGFGHDVLKGNQTGDDDDVPCVLCADLDPISPPYRHAMLFIGKWIAFMYRFTVASHPPIHTPTAVSTMQGNNQHIRSS